MCSSFTVSQSSLVNSPRAWCGNVPTFLVMPGGLFTYTSTWGGGYIGFFPPFWSSVPPWGYSNLPTRPLPYLGHFRPPHMAGTSQVSHPPTLILCISIKFYCITVMAFNTHSPYYMYYILFTFISKIN